MDISKGYCLLWAGLSLGLIIGFGCSKEAPLEESAARQEAEELTEEANNSSDDGARENGVHSERADTERASMGRREDGAGTDSIAREQYSKSPRERVAPVDSRARTWRELEAQIHDWVKEARRYETQFDFAKAVPVWRKVVDTVQTELGKDAWQTRNAWLSLSSARQQAAMSDRDLEIFKETVRQNEAIREGLSEQDWARVNEIMPELIARSSELFDEDSSVVGRLRLRFGQMLYQQGRYEKAKEELKVAYQINTETLGDVHPETEKNVHLLAQSNIRLRKFAVGIEYFQKACKLSKRLWGAQHPATASRINDLGVAYQANQQPALAIEEFKKALKIRRKSLPENHRAIGDTLRNLGVCEMDLKRHDSAVNYLRQAIQIFADTIGERNALTLDTRTQLAVVNMLQNRYLAAESELRQVVHAFKSDGHGQVKLAKASFQLAVALGHQGQYHEAEPLLQQALRIQRKHLGQWHTDTVRTLRTLAVLYERTGKEDLAISIHESLRRLEAESDR